MDEIFLAIVILVGVLVLSIIFGLIAIIKTNRFARELKELRAQFSELKNQYINGALPANSDQSPSDITQSNKPEIDEAQRATEIEPEQAPETTIAAKSIIPQISGSNINNGTSETLTGEDEPEPPARRNLEETIGSLWAVWIGGIALALGAVFLVKYSIERDLLNPAVRISLGAGFSAALIAAGEWTRRRGDFSFAAFGKANIPAILTAAGTMGLFASTYAAYAIYDMMSPSLTFVILGLVAVATTVTALLHGPLLAGLGMLASYLVPPLVASDTPHIPELAGYILAVSIAGFTVGRLRHWKWLAVMIAAGLILYGGVLLFIAEGTQRPIILAYFVASYLLTAYVFFISLFQRLAPNLYPLEKIAIVLLSGLQFLHLSGLLANGVDNYAYATIFFALIAPFALALFYSASRAIIYSAIGFVFLSYLSWNVNFFAVPGTFEMGADIKILLSQFQIRDQLSSFHNLGFLLAGLALASALWAIKISASRAAMAIGGAFLPLLLLGANYLRVAEFSVSTTYGFVALVAFALYLFLSNLIYLRLEKSVDGRDEASAAFAVAAFVALALAISFTLEKAALTIALAMLVPAITFVNWRRPLPALRILSVVAAGLWIARIIWQPNIIDGPIGSTPIFNWLTYGYGIPTAGFAAAIWMLGSAHRDKWLEILEAITLASFVTTLALVCLHAISPDQVFTKIDTLQEVALMALIGAGVALGLGMIKRTANSQVLRAAVTGLGAAGMLVAIIGLLVVYNPWLSDEPLGTNIVFNQLLYAYFATGVLYNVLGWYLRKKRHKAYIYGAFLSGALLLFVWVNITIRHLYHPAGLHWGPTYQSELYTYSIVWLLIAIALLTVGIFWRNKTIRVGSVGVLVAVVAKVFLIDMAQLEGILRALSFIGLGATLIGIGLVYQRVLSKPDTNPDEFLPAEVGHSDDGG